VTVLAVSQPLVQASGEHGGERLGQHLLHLQEPGGRRTANQRAERLSTRE
jgi:hypothetical protein